MAENTLPIHTERLYESILAVCPIGSLNVNTDTQGVVFVAGAGATAPQIAAANAVIAAFDWSLAAYNTWLVNKVRQRAKDALDAALERENRIDRAIAQIMLQEVNNLRQWMMDFKAQTALATNLANLQTRVAALPNLPQYTENQLITAIKNRI